MIQTILVIMHLHQRKRVKRMTKANIHSILPMLIIVSLIIIFSSIAIWLVHFEPNVRQQSHSTSPNSELENLVTIPESDQYEPVMAVKEQSDAKPHNPPELVWLNRPFWQLDGLLTDKLPALQLAYQNGDKAAGFVIAAYLSRCNKAPSSKADLEEKVEFAIETGEADLAERLTQRYNFCQGVPEEMREQHLTRFITLSKDGFTPALEVIGSIPSKQYMEYMKLEELPRDEYISARDAFEKSKYQYLTQAANQGSILALLKLSDMNAHSPKHIEESRNKGHTSLSLALANASVAKHFTTNDLVYGRAEFIQSRLYQKASAKEIFLAESLSANMVSKIQKIGHAYPAREKDRWVFTFY